MEEALQRYMKFLNRNDMTKAKIVTKQRVDAHIEDWVKTFNTFLVYPDLLADIMTPSYSDFSLFFSQRIVLREMARCRQSYHTYTRSYSKSFLAAYDRYTKCMLIPRHKAFVVSGTKEQAAKIAKEKVIDDLWIKFPLLKSEMVKTGRQAAYVNSNNAIEFRFTSGSIMDVVGGHPRGLRRNSGIFEEMIELDETIINEEVIPLVNAPRTMKNGKINPREPNGSKIFVTTAGYMQTYAYNKLIETLCYSVLDPQNFAVSGGSYIIPMMHGRIAEQTIRELVASNAFKREAFEREYVSRWSGAIEGSVFNYNMMESLSTIVNAELKSNLPPDSEEFYVVSADMAKDGSAKTAVVVAKVVPKEYNFDYRFINLFTIDNTDYAAVANVLKETAFAYNARLLIYDANGIGSALRDWINKPSVNSQGTRLPGLGIINPPPDSERDVIKHPKELTICYEIKSGGEKGKRIHNFFLGRMSSRNIHFLIKQSDAVARLQKLKGFMEASLAKKKLKLLPYSMTEELKLEFENLIFVEVDSQLGTANIKRKDTTIQKDFFSASEYLVFATNAVIENEYYKRQNSKKSKIKSAFMVD